MINDRNEISQFIQKEYSLKKPMSDCLADVVIKVYSDKNRKEWELKDQEGLRSFLENDFNITWKGFATWYYSPGYVNCYYEANIELVPTEDIFDNVELKKSINNNPFIKKEDIENLFANSLCRYLDQEFDYYCTCEDYEPTVEDYYLEEEIENWCNKNGFELISCEGNEYDTGFESDF